MSGAKQSEKKEFVIEGISKQCWLTTQECDCFDVVDDVEDYDDKLRPILQKLEGKTIRVTIEVLEDTNIILWDGMKKVVE